MDTHDGGFGGGAEAMLLAHDGPCGETASGPRDPTTLLYRDAGRSYFVQRRSAERPPRSRFEPVHVMEAIALWEGDLCEHLCTLDEAFPGLTMLRCLNEGRC